MRTSVFRLIYRPTAVFKTILTTFCIFLISACSPSEPPLRVALLEWPPYELAFWAQDQGWLDKERVELLEYKTPAEVSRAFASGSVDIIAVTTDFALALAAQQPDTRIFVVIDSSNGGDVILSRQPVASASALRGKTLAVEAGPLGNFMLSRFLDRYGLSRSDLNIEYVDIPQHVEHWKISDVDLIITYEPSKTRILKEGAQVVFSSKEIPNEIVDVFIARESVIKNRKSDLDHFTHVWFKAVDDLHGNKPEVFSFIGERESIPADEIKAAFMEIRVPSLDENLMLLSGKDPALFRGVELNEKVMRLSSMLPSGATINKDKLITPEIVEEME